MNEILENDIYLDPLTGMPNFFKFIESEVKDIFREKGSIIIFDMAKFEEVNRIHGREVGDLFLRNFSHVLRSELLCCKNVLVFRTHGDEFTTILQDMSCSDAKRLSLLVKQSFKTTMAEVGFVNVDIHTLILEYNNDITSINQFYKKVFKKSLQELNFDDGKFSEERLIESVIGNFTNRIQETLLLLNNAYSLALTDDVSTLPNQRAAQMYFKSLMKESKEDNNSFSMLFIDGDNLKKYNQISYAAGNEMIKSLSSVIANSIRKNDKIFRWLSGDEFLVVLDKVDYQVGLKLAERIRMTVEEETKSWRYPITVSIGMASFPDDGLSIKDILNKAEKANFYAKNSGKNKVVRWANSFGNAV